MTSELGIFFLGQSVIIIGAVVAAYVGTKVQLARLEVQVKALQDGHAGRERKIEGMSRHLSELTGEVRSCPALKERRG